MMGFGRVLGISAIALVLFGGFVAVPTAFAEEWSYLYRSPRMQAMGGAVVAWPTEEQALYFNPAALAGQEKINANFAVLDLGVSSDVIGTVQNSAKIFNKFNGNTINQLMGKNILFEGQFVPFFLMPYFGVSYLVGGQMGLFAQNPAYPNVTILDQTTNGIQVGFGYPILGKGRRSSNELRFGVAAKMMYRRGGVRQLSSAAITQFNKNTLDGMVGNTGKGYGADAGLQYIHHINKGLKWSMGVSWLDFGDTTFGDSNADPQKQNITVGGGLRYDSKLADLTLLYDVSHLKTPGDWRKRSHLGMEIKLPIFSIMGGVNQTYFTYGAAFDFWLMRLTVTSYRTEMAEVVYTEPDRRYDLRLAFKVEL